MEIVKSLMCDKLIAALKPFAELADAFNNTRSGPWYCDPLKGGCGKTHNQDEAICSRMYTGTDILIDVAGVRIRRHVWLSDCRAARRAIQEAQDE